MKHCLASHLHWEYLIIIFNFSHLRASCPLLIVAQSLFTISGEHWCLQGWVSLDAYFSLWGIARWSCLHWLWKEAETDWNYVVGASSTEFRGIFTGDNSPLLGAHCKFRARLRGDWEQSQTQNIFHPLKSLSWFPTGHVYTADTEAGCQDPRTTHVSNYHLYT